jgi:threonine/homoserine/homoserine lactone efflux protein
VIPYLAVTFALVITPGATTAVVMRQTLRGGRRAGIGAAAGAAIANSTHALAAGLGLAIVLVRVPLLASAIRAGGCAFLAWLGIQSLRRAWWPPASRAGRSEDRPLHSALREGVLVNLLNPAIATFYLVVVPTFLSPGAGWTRYALLAAIHVVMAFTCHVGWSLLFDRVRTSSRSPQFIRALDAIAGVALLFLAARTLTAGTR